MIGYQTQNVAIATMLHTLGVPWSKNPQTGREEPCYVQYSHEMLCKMLSAIPELKGMDIVDAATLAHRRGKKGLVKYNFERGPLFDRLIAAWNKQEEWIQKSDQSNAGEGTTMMEFPSIEPEDAARLFCQWSKNRGIVANIWKGAVPQVIEEGPVRNAGKDARGWDVKEGSMKVLSVNASAATRKRIGL